MIQLEFKYLLQSLLYSSRKTQDGTIKEILTSVRNLRDEDLQDLFGLLNSTRDMVLQVKLFSILAAHLLSSGNNNEMIVTYRPLYDRIQDVLNGGLSHRTTTTLNFVTALLSVYNGDESPSPRQKSLALFARNMIRISGCLATMCNMFTSCMMYQDTWFALCHCLAEACRGCEINQNYCTHLVPMCVKKCQQVNVEVCSLLQSMLDNNDRNVQVFLDNDGLTIFTRELLQDDTCMHLLNTICKSTRANTVLRVTHIPQVLHDLMHFYGRYSKIGQWAKIVLHHFDSRSRMPSIACDARMPNLEYKLKSNILEDQHKVESFQEEQFSPERTRVSSRKCSPDETAQLFQNVINEVTNWKAQSKPKPPSPLRQNKKLRLNYKLNDNTRSIKQWTLRNDEEKENGNFSGTKDMSFSFLLKEDFRNPSKNGDRVHSMSKPTRNNVMTQTDAAKIFTKTKAPGLGNREEMNNTFESDERSIIFAPVQSSTPRNKRGSCNKTTISKISCMNRSVTPISYRRKKRGIQKPRIREAANTMQEIKNGSLTSRFFSVINESCTTLVKSVKSMFKSKENSQKKKHDTETRFSNYSFTNYYMRRRDALLEDKCIEIETTGYEDFSTEKSYVNSCRTCDDTVILKHKLANDKYLKQTLKKLKLGVNLYGCDFKKLSMVIWPQEKYMTPNVLYNLYRKLIVKK